MRLLDLIDELERNGNAEKAVQMKAYMRDQFEFLGIPTPERKSICKPYFAEAKKGGRVDWAFVNTCWRSVYREVQYAALDYLRIMQRKLDAGDIEALRRLALEKSWWDTIDGLDEIVGTIALADPSVNETLIAWSTDGNLWLRRIAIDHQLQRKEKTDTALLETTIINNFGSNEFFVNKAIGWSLREYSKTNPDWVRGFIEKHRSEMASLSIKEAGKYL